MGKRRDTMAARHAGGWIVLGWGVLAFAGILASFRASKPSIPVGPNSTQLPVGIPSFPVLAIDLNTASESELSCLPGIGPTLARRIVEHREKQGPLFDIGDLQRIPGVGPKLLGQLRGAFENSPVAPSTRDKLVDQFSTTRRNVMQHD